MSPLDENELDTLLERARRLAGLPEQRDAHQSPQWEQDEEWDEPDWDVPQAWAADEWSDPDSLADLPSSGVGLLEGPQDTEPADQRRSRRRSDEYGSDGGPPDEEDNHGRGPAERRTGRDRREGNGRASAALEATRLDSDDMPFTPVARPGTAIGGRLVSLAFTALFVAFLAWLIVPEVQLRIRSIDTVTLSNGVLTAQPVQLAPARPAVVSKLHVSASDVNDTVLPKNTSIATLNGLSNNGLSNVDTELRVPFNARLASIDQFEGGVTLPGTPVATVYDPSRMYVVASVQPSTLDLLRRGMRVTMTSNVVATPIHGTVVSAVPLLGTDHNPTTAQLVNVRVKPDGREMDSLVPGIRFRVTVDLSSVGEDAPLLVFTGDPGIDVDTDTTTPSQGASPSSSAAGSRTATRKGSAGASGGASGGTSAPPSN